MSFVRSRGAESSRLRPDRSSFACSTPSRYAGPTGIGPRGRPEVTSTTDDFGMGYSSLRALRHIPFDELGTHRSFASSIGASGESVVLAANSYP